MANLIVAIFFILFAVTVISGGTFLFTSLYVPWRMKRYIRDEELKL